MKPISAEIYYYDNLHPSEAEQDVKDLWFALRPSKRTYELKMKKSFFRKHYEMVWDYVVDDSKDFLETIFADFNCDDNPLATKDGQCVLQSLGVRHTSMSVGDIIRVGDEYHIVCNEGFALVILLEDDEMVAEPKTIGEASHRLAVEYIELYEKLKVDKDKTIRARAIGLAKHDLVAKRVIADFALRELDEYIKKDGGVIE
jgi:hypothetical protein